MTDIVISTEAKLIAATPLFSVARAACERLKGLDSSTSGGQKDALVAIVFSAMSLEAFLNELPEYLCMFPELTKHDPPEISSYIGLAEEVESNKGSIKLKYILAHTVLSGRPCDKGKAIYEDFSLLIDVRNDLMHAKPRNISGTAGADGTIQFEAKEKMLAKLRAKKILDISQQVMNIPIIEPNGVEKVIPMEAPRPFHDRVATRAAAYWACNTVADVVESLLNVVPDSHNKSNLMHLRQHFGHIT
jgi:hypothetical protein